MHLGVTSITGKYAINELLGIRGRDVGLKVGTDNKTYSSMTDLSVV